jgi:glycerol-3-phosphate cytidylyltransferase
VNVLTIGTFDRLHVGHLELLAACRQLAGPEGVVSVAVNRDEFVERFKGVTPQPLAHRLEMLQAVRLVDRVYLNVGDEDARLVIDAVMPDALAIGDDWLDPVHDERRYFRQLGVTAEWMAERSLRVTYVPRTRGVSSTALRATA